MQQDEIVDHKRPGTSEQKTATVGKRRTNEEQTNQWNHKKADLVEKGLTAKLRKGVKREDSETPKLGLISKWGI
jgi:hypothetical protein